MRRRLLLAALACAALVAWNLALESRAVERRSARGRVGRVLPAERRQGLPVAALRLEAAGGERWTYVRRAGRWSGLSFPGVCDGAAIEGLIAGLLEARGLVVSEDTAEAPAYGIAAPQTLVVSLCGPRAQGDPGGDVLEAFEIGSSVPARETSFLRRRGERAIWSLDADLRAPLLRRGRPGLPPLLEPCVVPQAWPGWREGLARVRVERSGAPSFVLERRSVEVTPEELGRGQRPWSWTVVGDQGETEAAPAADAFAGFLPRAPWSDVLDPASGAGAPPRARLVLEGAQGAALELLFGAPTAAGTPLEVPAFESLVLVTPEVEALLLPAVEALTSPEEDDPWSAFLRSAAGGG